MKTTKFYAYVTMSLFFVMVLFQGKSSAQNIFGTPLSQYKISVVSESAKKASYRLSANGFNLGVVLEKMSHTNVVISMRMNGKNIGGGRAFIKNGQPDVKIAKAIKGTHGAWVFAMRILLCKEAKLALMPLNQMKRKIARDCFDKCKQIILGRPVVVAFAIKGGGPKPPTAPQPPAAKSGRPKQPTAPQPPMFLKAAEINTVARAFARFLDCMCGCIVDSMN